MTDLNNEISGIKKTEPEELQWLNEPYRGMVQIKDIQLSENVKKGDGKAYSGKPFFKFLLKTPEKEQVWIIFWREIPGDDDEKNRKKRDRLKKFLDNAKADESKEGLEYLQSTIGKKLQVCIKKKDEFITNKQGIPEIRSNVFYSYSVSATENIGEDNGKQYYRLSDEDRNKFNSACAAYENQTGKSIQQEGALDEAKGEDFIDQEFPTNEPIP